MRSFRLRLARLRLENGAVRVQSKALLVLALLCLPWVGAGQQMDGSKAHAIPPPAVRADINHASVDELMKVPGMTRTWAGRIVRFRPYRSKQDLLDRGVLTSEVYDRIKDYVIAHREQQ